MIFSRTLYKVLLSSWFASLDDVFLGIKLYYGVLIFSVFFFILLHSGVIDDPLYRELWHACAGPLVTLPREGERVYYFPQGHMEQVCLLYYTLLDLITF